MKALPIITFATGGAAGALAMWLLSSSSAPEEAKSGTVSTAQLLTDNKSLTEKVKTLEKQVAAAKDKGKAALAGPGITEEVEKDGKKVITHKFDESGIHEMMKQQGAREAAQEADKLALRLKLSPDQKESLRKFLLDQKEKQHAMFQSAMKEGKKVEVKKDGQSKDEFLKSLLTPDQQAEYAKSQEEQRTARAEDYAQRKVRKLNDQLSLTEDQKEKLFQAFAQQRLAATDPAKPSAAPGDTVAPVHGGAIAFASVAGGPGGEPVQFEMDMADMLSPGSGDLDHSVMESVLTPEQLGVYDQRKAEEKDRAKTMGLPGLPALPPGGGAIRIEVQHEETTAPPP